MSGISIYPKKSYLCPYISTNTESVSLLPNDERRKFNAEGVGIHLVASYPLSDIGVGVVASFILQGNPTTYRSKNRLSAPRFLYALTDRGADRTIFIFYEEVFLFSDGGRPSVGCGCLGGLW